MIALDLLQYSDQLQFKKIDKTKYIFDPIRKKHLVVGPEEIVRQLLIIYLLKEKNYNHNRIAIEKGLKVNGLSKRCDILIYSPDMQPLLLIECKAPEVELTQATFDQIARYNMPLQVKYLMVSNGRSNYCCEMDYEKESYSFLKEIPSYTYK